MDHRPAGGALDAPAPRRPVQDDGFLPWTSWPAGLTWRLGAVAAGLLGTSFVLQQGAAQQAPAGNFSASG